MSNITSVKVRMYNTGSVGDCLLLLFMKDKTITFKMMIDCGGWNTNSAAITPCVKDINTICNGEIDLLVVTHQHEDHVSGFNQARVEFEKIKVNEVWMSWIENKKDTIAIILKERYGKKIKELRKSIELALHTLKAGPVEKGFQARRNMKVNRMANALELVKFEEGESYAKNLAPGKRTNEDAMNYVKAKTKNIKYRRPGQVVDNLQGADGIKFFVLGPPRDKDMKYFKIDMEDDEMYHLALRADAKAASEEEEEEPLYTERLFMNDIALEDGISPFSAEYKMVGKEASNFLKEYNGKDMRWRQIETDWLESDAGIAMRATNLTNNTSLAMAIELPNGKVLLLPGDAQSGNWLGWHKSDVKKRLKNNGGKDTDELLRDTVFYKVGHHGSHNGTASKSGLDKITNENLVAMMPLVQAKVPKEWGGAKNFPAGPLYEELVTKTQGRVIRTDEGIITMARAKKLRGKLDATQKKEFEDMYKKGSCYVEYTVNCKG
jgi:beta-lactamase superfamily II metal-dependent hydrolase